MFPEFPFRAFTTPAVGRYQQRGGVAMIINAHFLPPIPYALDRKLGHVFRTGNYWHRKTKKRPEHFEKLFNAKSD